MEIRIYWPHPHKYTMLGPKWTKSRYRLTGILILQQCKSAIQGDFLGVIEDNFTLLNMERVMGVVNIF